MAANRRTGGGRPGKSLDSSSERQQRHNQASEGEGRGKPRIADPNCSRGTTRRATVAIPKAKQKKISDLSFQVYQGEWPARRESQSTIRTLGTCKWITGVRGISAWTFKG